ncbi:alpha/beta hydrolase family protein [Sphingomonas sp. UYP23]
MFDRARGWLAAILLPVLIAAAPAPAPPPVPIMAVDPVVIPAANGQRALLVRVTAPAAPHGRLPVILFSHGAALSRSHYAPLVDYWARAGFVVLQPDHEDGVIDGFPPPAPPSAKLWRTRILDLQRLAHALPRIEAAVSALRGHLDAGKLLVAGHSFGGHTVAALMGAKVWNVAIHQFESFAMPSIRGALLLSPPGAGGADLSDAFQPRGGFLTVDWSTLRGPMLTVVGGDDDSVALSPRGPGWHADIYRRSTTSDQCLITVTRARHYLGGIVDPRRTGVEDADPARLAAVRAASVALFHAALAGRRLTTAAFTPLGTQGMVECR